ncbi:pseudouridine synthase [Saccharopolyspora sp. ID03-671]|uniref:pseudouridine synthase n=1 Tax=Saccharopolyspora sp. ID03-671 TaxID=3073066 RepID=UPI003245F9B6
MRRKLRSPLPQRDGLDPVRVHLPTDGRWATVRDFLVERLPKLSPALVDEMLAAGRFVTRDGPVAADEAFRPGGFVWFHRDVAPETPVPFELEVLHRDEEILVVDKPHFLATTPRGGHITETALIRLRRQLDLPDLSPAHRLDRATAGLVLFVVDPALRGAYQTLFHDRRVDKTYEAIAPHDPGLTFPRTIRSRIVKHRGVLAAFEEAGEPNAETRVELLESRGALARYRLHPRTGRTHQLRVHLNSLGLPIVGDDLYPEVRPKPPDDFTAPLKLLARSLEFPDPRTGRPRHFHSRRTLPWP